MGLRGNVGVGKLETLRPVASERGGQQALSIAMVDRIAQDHAAYFFDEDRITQVVVLADDQVLTQRLVSLLKDRRIPSDVKRAYPQGLLHLVLANRHIAEPAVWDARLIVAGARQAGAL